jgi:hypothetical protein
MMWVTLLFTWDKLTVQVVQSKVPLILMIPSVDSYCKSGCAPSQRITIDAPSPVRLTPLIFALRVKSRPTGILPE